jgi:hypothetical protein
MVTPISLSNRMLPSSQKSIKRAKPQTWKRLIPAAFVVLTFGYLVFVVRRPFTSGEEALARSVVSSREILVNSRLQSSEINEWIDQYPNTPGARFIHLLRKHIHYETGAEDRRINDCFKSRLQCFGGAQASEEMTTTIIPTTQMTMQEFLYLTKTDTIPRLGTDPVCLPLILAGQAIQEAGVVVEFGPFAGMTTRCLGLGLNQTGAKNAIFSFDTFENEDNWGAIRQQAKWVVNVPEYDPKKNFIWVWERVVHGVYPTAKAIPGFISKETAHPAVWNNDEIAVLSLDSVKGVLHWQDQLEGIRMLKAGSILALQDFILTDQPTIVYGCLREYLMPVFTCWEFWEPWIFVVKKDMSLQLPCKCLKNLQDDYADTMEEQVIRDLDVMGDSSMVEKKNKTIAKMTEVFRTNGQCNNRATRGRARAGRMICKRGK